MVKIDLITGFLGSGKTTFLKQYALHLMSNGVKVGILEYDYGAINSDMALLKELRGEMCEIEMLAAACDSDCLNRRFRTKLIALAMSGYDRIIIEPSGVFDMDMFFDTLRESPLEYMYEIGNVISIVDATLQSEMTKEEDFILASQVACSGSVVLSRTQLTDESTISNTKEHIRKALNMIGCNNICPKYTEKNWADFNESDFSALLSCGYKKADYIKLFSADESEFSSVSFLDVTDNIESLTSKINLLFSDKECGEILRVKGFIEDSGHMHLINATRHKTECKEIDFNQKVLIVIGRKLNKSKIEDIIKTSRN